MRRSAWKQCRSCPLASSAMCADSFASHLLAGWICSPSASSTVVTGCCASQSICNSGRSFRSSFASATSLRACPSPIGEDKYSARLGRDAARGQVVAFMEAPVTPSSRYPIDELLDEEIHPYRITRLRRMSGTVEQDQRSV